MRWRANSARSPTKALKGKTQDLRGRRQQGEPLEQIIPEAFAVVREAARRTLDMRHFDVQLIGGITLHEGHIAEMRTGEGKTLVATLPAYLNALDGQSVHIVTPNDYLARRDAEWMGAVYAFLGLRTGVVVPGQSAAEKREVPTPPMSSTAPTTSWGSTTSATTWPSAPPTRCRARSASR